MELGRRGGERTYSIRTADGKTTTVAVADIGFMESTSQSLMPGSQVRDLTAQQTADLVEFLHTQN